MLYCTNLVLFKNDNFKINYLVQLGVNDTHINNKYDKTKKILTKIFTIYQTL